MRQRTAPSRYCCKMLTVVCKCAQTLIGWNVYTKINYFILRITRKVIWSIICSPILFLSSVWKVSRKCHAFLQIRWIIHKCLTMEVEQGQSGREWLLLAFGKGVSFFYLEQKTTVAFVLCKKFYTLELFSYFFNMNCLFVATFVSWKSSNFISLLNPLFTNYCHVQTVLGLIFPCFIFSFKLDFQCLQYCVCLFIWCLT